MEDRAEVTSNFGEGDCGVEFSLGGAEWGLCLCLGAVCDACACEHDTVSSGGLLFGLDVSKGGIHKASKSWS